MSAPQNQPSVELSDEKSDENARCPERFLRLARECPPLSAQLEKSEICSKITDDLQKYIISLSDEESESYRQLKVTFVKSWRKRIFQIAVL
eukprot:781791_1